MSPSGSDGPSDRGRAPTNDDDSTAERAAVDSPANDAPTATPRETGTPPVGQDDGRPAPERRDETFGWWEFGFDIVSSVAAVFMVGLLLFAVSGVWPPLVAVESESMVPNMQVGDLVFVMEEHRFPGENAHARTGVVPARATERYRKFDRPGDVIVFAPNGNGAQTPIIHRAMFWVEDGEDWYARADSEFVGGADDCGELSHCPAPHAGFITLGDNNGVYDQVRPSLQPVKPAWVVGTAEVRVPALGWVRLRSSQGLVLESGSLEIESDSFARGSASARPTAQNATATSRSGTATPGSSGEGATG